MYSIQQYTTFLVLRVFVEIFSLLPRIFSLISRIFRAVQRGGFWRRNYTWPYRPYFDIYQNYRKKLPPRVKEKYSASSWGYCVVKKKMRTKAMHFKILGFNCSLYSEKFKTSLIYTISQLQKLENELMIKSSKFFYT